MTSSRAYSSRMAAGIASAVSEVYLVEGRNLELPLALCDALTPDSDTQPSPEQRLKAWLERRGCQMENLEIRPSTVRVCGMC
jgi:hypothetical protein